MTRSPLVDFLLKTNSVSYKMYKGKVIMETGACPVVEEGSQA